MTAARPFACVVAADLDGGIGKDNDLPWPRLATDLRSFKRLTTAAGEGRENALIMGRLTWESIPPALRPLPGRRNIVVSRGRPELPASVWLARSLEDALSQVDAAPSIERAFVIGGGQIYAQAFVHPGCGEVVLTRLQARFACDTFIPALGDFELAEVLASDVQEAGITYNIERWRRRGG